MSCDINQLTKINIMKTIQNLLYDYSSKAHNQKSITIPLVKIKTELNTKLNCIVDDNMIKTEIDKYNSKVKYPYPTILIYKEKMTDQPINKPINTQPGYTLGHNARIIVDDIVDDIVDNKYQQIDPSEEKIINDLIYKYNLWPKDIKQFYNIPEKQYHPNHGKILAICPPYYAVDIDTGACLSTDIIPLGSFYNYRGKLIAGNARSLLLHFKKHEGSWQNVIKLFEPIKITNKESVPILSNVFSFDNITYFTSTWPSFVQYIPDFLNSVLDKKLFDKINLLSWEQPEVLPYTKKIDRDILQYGYIYDYNIKDSVGHPLVKLQNNKTPEFIQCIVDLIWNNFGNKNYEPNQILITKFKPGQGIGPLKDHPMFEPISITLSLGSKATFKLTESKKDSKKNTIEFPLLPGSLLILDDKDSKKEKDLWTQEIPSRLEDTYTMNFLQPQIIKWKRSERITITIRSLKKEYQGEIIDK